MSGGCPQAQIERRPRRWSFRVLPSRLRFDEVQRARRVDFESDLTRGDGWQLPFLESQLDSFAFSGEVHPLKVSWWRYHQRTKICALGCHVSGNPRKRLASEVPGGSESGAGAQLHCDAVSCARWRPASEQLRRLCMLTLRLACREARCGTLRTLRGLIAEATPGNASDYWVSLFDENQRPRHRALLIGYPRWAESTRAFLGRCLDAALLTSNRSEWFLVDSCELTATEWRTQEVVDMVSFGDVWRPTPVHCPPQRAMGRTAWELMRWVCAQDAFGGQDLPELPAPVRPTIYERRGVRYCRTSELPIEARVAFERLQAFLDRPFVPTVPDAVYPWWLEAFLREELSTKSMHAIAWR